MSKKSISDKAFLVLLFGTIIMVLLSSCSPDEITETVVVDSECITTGYDVLEGEYASVNGSIVLYFNLNGTMAVRQDGILNGVSSYCFTPDGQYLKFTNEYDQISYLLYSIVDMPETKGIVLDGEFYRTVNN
jgi:hypothetical protein